MVATVRAFLAFSEIHPDYYRIPIEDREALVAAERESADDEDGDAEDGESRPETVGGEDDRRRGHPPEAVRSVEYKIQEVSLAQADHAGAGGQGRARATRARL